jgi:hypothetical protein
MSRDSDTAQTLCARKSTQHQCAIGWHLSLGAAILAYYLNTTYGGR